jgi:hypothetical protein
VDLYITLDKIEDLFLPPGACLHGVCILFQAGAKSNHWARSREFRG